jgi:hypothetical protein
MSFAHHLTKLDFKKNSGNYIINPRTPGITGVNKLSSNGLCHH